jgi:hypothetical protein
VDLLNLPSSPRATAPPNSIDANDQRVGTSHRFFDNGTGETPLSKHERAFAENFLRVTTLPAVGVHPTATDRSMPILDLASETEARGLKSIFLPEHTHAPERTETLVAGWPIAERYQRTLDPYIGCAYIAATTSLEVGTGISLVAQHDAIALAKTVATLDYLTRAGWYLASASGTTGKRPRITDLRPATGLPSSRRPWR